MLRTLHRACGDPGHICGQEDLHSEVPNGESRCCDANELELFELSERLSHIGVPRTIDDDGSFRSVNGTIAGNPSQEALLLLSQHLFKKYNVSEEVTKAQAQVAFDKMLKSEQRNGDTNRRFSVPWKYHGEWHQYLAYARGEIARLLRSPEITDTVVTTDCDLTVAPWLKLAVAPHMGFGPGSSTRLPRRKGDASYKYSGKPHVTGSAALLAMDVRSTSVAWIPVNLRKHIPYMLRDRKIGLIKELFEQVKGDVLDVVPKDSSSGRMIGKQPDMNLYLQKGLGGFMRQRLKGVGINLDDQTQNANAALEGSVTNHLSTIDLSDASNSNALMVTQTLFPEEIYDYIVKTRVAYGEVPEIVDCGTRTVKYEMVSAMGNGYTFELMTTILWALARSVVHIHNARDKRILVYGDDIIVSNQDGVTDTLIKLMRYCGYLINDTKSFVDGPYRESCGMHAVSGSVITPFYIRRPVVEPTELRLLHNNLWRWRHRCQNLLDAYQVSEIERTLAWIRGHDLTEHLFIPDGFGDGAYTAYTADLVVRRHKGQWECFTFKHYTFRKDGIVHENEGLLCKSLLGLESKSFELPFVGINRNDLKPVITESNRKGGERKQRTTVKMGTKPLVGGERLRDVSHGSDRNLSMDDVYPVDNSGCEKSVKQQLLVPELPGDQAWWCSLGADDFVFDPEQRLNKQLVAELLAVRHTLLTAI